MTDERMDRLEQELRAWLAAEARHVAVPTGLRQRATELRDTAAPHGRFAGWALRPVVLAGATVALAVLVGLTVALSGVLPLGRPDCSEVTIERVRAAVADVPGYRWQMTGTELVSHLTGLDENRQAVFAYSTAQLEFAGAYDAPDAWRIDVLRGYDPDLVLPPSTGLLVSDQWDGYLVADGSAWLRPVGAADYQPAGENGDLQLHRWANQLLGLLHGEPFLIAFNPDTPWGSDLTWAVESVAGGCLMTGTGHLEDAPEGYERVVAFLVDPETMLPSTGSYRFALSAIPARTAGEGNASQEDVRLAFTYDYDESPRITSPVDTGFQPVEPVQAIAAAQELGVGEAPTMAQYQLGTAQAFLVHGPRLSAALVYVNGLLQQQALVQSDLDVWITLLGSGEPDAATFLAAVINDPRVASVEVSFSDGPPQTLPGFSAHPLTLTNGEGLGGIVTWTAYDDAGNELSVEPPPP